MTSKTPSSSVNEPPLECEERVEIDSEFGVQVSVTILRRGILGQAIKRYDPPSAAAVTRDISPREVFAQICDGLRDELHNFGLPSDRTPYWIRLGENDWRPISDRREKIEGFTERSFWIFRVRELTEPLSRARLAGEFLFELLNLLRRDGIGNHLKNIGWLIQSYHPYMIAGWINSLATAELEARKSRANGPRIRKARAGEVRRIIGKHARQYWKLHPNYSGDASNTARQIADSVNKILRTRKLLPLSKRGLSSKTISDYIRTSVNGNLSELRNSETRMDNSEIPVAAQEQAIR
jgi:hypothetical protein